MSENDHEKNQFQPYFPKDEPDTYAIDVPAEPRPGAYDRVPSADDPMGRIELRGRAFQRLASGRTPWWQLIAGWIVFGAIALMLAKIAINAGAITPWILLIIALLPLVILARGTLTRVSARGRRGR